MALPSTLFKVSFSFLVSSWVAYGAAVQTTYIVVGGGTAGLAVATRLSENSANNVIVLEAGGSGFDNPNIANLSGVCIEALPNTSVDWNYTSQPLKFATNQTVAMTRGHVLGGSSAVNGALFVRPNKIDLDLWETSFNATGWNWNSISASIKTAEHFTATAGLPSTLSFHGTSGPICNAQRTPVGDVWTQGVIPAVLACNGTESQDQDGGNPSGIWYTPKALFPNSTRSYSANSYYLPNAGRKNLQVMLDVTVSKILWGTSKKGKAFATGVQYINTITGKTSTISGDRIILSAGTFGTPQVLELSGIMNPLGISTVVNIPAVGENLAEQPTTKYVAALASGITNSGLQLTLNYESPRTLLNDTEWNIAFSLLQTAPPGLSEASHQALIAMFLTDSVLVEFMGFPNPSDLIFLPILLHPMSRGSTHIVSANATKAPSFDLALLESPFDLYILNKAAQRARRFASQPSLTPFLAPSGVIAPLANVTTEAEFDAFVKSSVGVAYHPLGTASLGTVVGSDLRVTGTANVFVVDGSIIPIQPGAHPSSIIYGIGEQAAAMLKTRPLSADI
ncbi:L-sorbose 1-dehydrogenase [Mycena sanguinolenta]|uniref:L-sorbose 1-dehydrogenase n=1 Tax=Mycena sanguinolenta TaxID=230812 RepID=A0A8H6XJI8_9AGAR|nr:L-sorbose 1-dehydrogenase [Mycena sanguinolenta]